MKWMFFGCENLDTLIVDKQRFASNATTVQGMFKNTKIDKNDVDGIRWHKDAVGQWEIQ